MTEMSEGARNAQALARQVKAALLHLRQAEDIAEMAGIDITDFGNETARLIRVAGEAVEDLDLWAVNNARAHGARPADTYAHTERWCHSEGGSLPESSWPRGCAVPPDDLPDSEGLRLVRAYLDQVGGEEAGS